MEEETDDQDITPKPGRSKWVLGIFYFNPDDQRLFPPKRIPWLGWTINFANPYSIAAMLLVIAAILCISKYN